MAGAKEFKQKFGEAMAHNEKLLEADEQEGESKDEEAGAPKADEAADKDAAETDLASLVKSKATLDEGDKSSES